MLKKVECGEIGVGTYFSILISSPRQRRLVPSQAPECNGSQVVADDAFHRVLLRRDRRLLRHAAAHRAARQQREY